jgi:hypothetical protein
MSRKFVFIILTAVALFVAACVAADPAMLSVADWQHHFITATAMVAVPAVEAGSFSIREWCAFRKYSIATFYKLRKNGIAPKVTQPPGTPPRITVEADREWLELVNNLNGEMAAVAGRLAEERRERAVAAVSKAGHVNKPRAA